MHKFHFRNPVLRAHAPLHLRSTPFLRHVTTKPLASAPHPHASAHGDAEDPSRPVYTNEELVGVKETHRERQGVRDWAAWSAVRLMRFGFDNATNYSDKLNVMTERQWLNRIVFLETVAGVPGMVGGMTLHMKSLNSLNQDRGWIHTLLEEAENERMHLMTFMGLRRPTPIFRFFVLTGQSIFFTLFAIAYALTPKTCHRFVGFLEEEAVHTYTNCLHDIEVGQIRHWATTPAPLVAKQYWKLQEGASIRDVVAAVRADEAEHRLRNHTIADKELEGLGKGGSGSAGEKDAAKMPSSVG